MKNLKNKLKEFSIRFLGNRVNLAGITLISTGICTIYLNEEMISIPSLIGFFSTFLGTVSIGATHLGKDTYENYVRAKQHLLKNKKFNPIYLENALKGKDRLIGYCDTQGVYLAAKETKHLDEFKKTKKQYSKNLIPHF